MYARRARLALRLEIARNEAADLGIVLLSIIGGAAYWHSHRNPAPLEQVYAGARKVTVCSSNAQVREPLEDASFGDRFDVLEPLGRQRASADGGGEWRVGSDRAI